MYVSQSSWLVPLYDPRDFHPRLANLCTTPLQFWSQPPQLNCPPDSVPQPDFYAAIAVRVNVSKERCSIVGPTCVEPPSYPRQLKTHRQCQVAVKLHGVFLSMCV